jgi:DNA-binding MarR family transcriptional regulator
MPLIKSSPPGMGMQHPIRELIRTFGLVERIMEPYFASFGISGSQWGVLRNLHRAEEEGTPALRLKELSSRLLIRPPSVTGLIDRLVRAGLVAREESSTDLRVKRVRLTEAGRRLVERILQVHDSQLQQLVDGISDEEQKNLNRLLTAWRKHLEEIVEQGHA